MHLAIIVPIKGRSDLLLPCLESIRNARAQAPNTELVLVDNNDHEQTDPVILAFSGDATVIRSNKKTIGAVRNDGVHALNTEPEVVVFLDSDCVVRPDFLVQVRTAFKSNPQIEIAGCKVIAPVDGHWTEIAGDELHRESGDGPRLHMNSGCMAIRYGVLSAVGGFSNILPANEDYDLCDRVRDQGGQIWQFETLAATHLGNPKTVTGVFQRLRWHGKGAIGENGELIVTAMSAAVLLNTLILVLAVVGSVALLFQHRWLLALLASFAAATFAPALVWIARSIQYKRWIRPYLAIPLMQITLFARQVGMIEQMIAARWRRRKVQTNRRTE